ncbi:MAG: hypothetical protein ABIY35_00995 [Chitinophagaceae bacterium]
MKSATFIIIMLFSGSISFAQTKKEQNFITTVSSVITAYSHHDSGAISKFIDNNIGIYQLDKIGVYPHYNHYKTLSFSDTTYPQVLFTQAKNIQLLPLEFASLPAWDCDKEIWSKKGLFVDTTKIDHLLSTICKDRNKYRPDTISEKTIRNFYDLENASRRIVLIDNNSKEFIFYLTYLKGQWFLTMIDHLSSDCSS